METFKITTDETLRETIQHGNNRYPFAYYPDNIWKFGNLTSIALTGIGIMN